MQDAGRHESWHENVIQLRENLPIVFLGDTHSVENLIRALKRLFETHKDGVDVLHVGDTGLTFDERKIKPQLNYVGDFLAHHQARLLAVRGNHDRKKFFTEGLRSRHENVVLLPDYSRLLYRHTEFICLGGSISVDREYRKKRGYEYDPEEMAVLPPKGMVPSSDRDTVILTHDVPEDLFDRYGTEFTSGDLSPLLPDDPLLLEHTRENRIIMTMVRSQFNPIAWFAGHYHRSFRTTMDDVYYKILTIGELDSPPRDIIP